MGDEPPIKADDFVTGFNRRVFEAIAELESLESGFSEAMLGQYFNVDEMGRIKSMELERRDLTRNDREVFLSLAANIKQAKLDAGAGLGVKDELALRRERLQKAKENKNT